SAHPCSRTQTTIAYNSSFRRRRPFARCRLRRSWTNVTHLCERRRVKRSTVSMDKLWTPSAARVEQATITDFARAHGFAASDYHALWRWSVDRRDVFWRALWDYARVIGEP